MGTEENSLRIDLLEEGQKIQQFTEMVENQYHLDDYCVLGASPVLMKIIYQFVLLQILYGY